MLQPRRNALRIARLPKHTHSIPMTLTKEDPMPPKAAEIEQPGGLVAAVLVKIKASENDKEPAAAGTQRAPGNGSGGLQPSRVPPSLQNAAAGLTIGGVTPLRKDPIGSSFAPGFPQEHDTLTQWVRA